MCSAAFLRAEDPLGWQAEEAERNGEVLRAWSLYTHAAAMEPKNSRWAGKALALRTTALDEAKIVYQDRGGEIPLDPSLVRPITDDELKEVERLLPPPAVKPTPGRRSVDLRGTSRTLWEQAMKACGLEAVFDGDYNLTDDIRLRLDDADCPEIVRTLEMISKSFIAPISAKLVLVVRDTPEKRREQERTVAVTIPLPEPVAVQEAQEMAKGVQQLFEIQKFAVDSTRRMVLMRDRYSKIKPAQLLFVELLLHRPQVVIDVEFIEVNRQNSKNFGLNLQNMTQIVNFGTFMNNTPNIMAGLTAANFATFGGGATLFGMALTSASLFASMSTSNATVKLDSQIRSLDGQPATFHVGDRYPIITQGYFGEVPTQGDQRVYRPPPTIQFEDLGLTLKITPRVHNSDEVTLDVDSEFKVLTSQTVNGIPVISNRKYAGQVRLKNGEWAVCAGLISTTDSKGYTGIAGLSQIPAAGWALRANQLSKIHSQILLVLKPRIVNLGPAEYTTKDIWVGTETKPLPAL